MLLISMSGPADAHHSFAEFDRTKTVTVSGVAKKWEWTNPHIYLTISAADTAGRVQDLTFEGFSPVILNRIGIHRDAVKVGDKVTVVYYPKRDGSPGGQMETLNGHATALGGGGQ